MNTTSWESDSKTDERIDKLADQLSTLVEIVSKKVVTPALVKAVEETCVTCGGAHSWYNCPTTDNNQASVCATTASTSGTLPSNTIPNPKGEKKAITTRSGVAYEGPSILTNPSPKKVVERETKETTDKEQTNFQGSTAHIPPPVIPIPILEPDVPKTLPKTTPIPEPDVPKSLPKPNIPYPSRRDDQKSRDKASNQMEKIFQIFQDLRFDISFADALLLMPRFAPTIKSLLMNKEKLLELAKIPLNENCSAMLLKKLPEKLGDPGKFLIPCNFPGMDIALSRSSFHLLIHLFPLLLDIRYLEGEWVDESVCFGSDLLASFLFRADTFRSGSRGRHATHSIRRAGSRKYALVLRVGNPPPTTNSLPWLGASDKQKPHSFEKAVAPVDAENWISHMEKIFDVMDCNDAFKTRLAVYKFEGDALAWWKAIRGQRRRMRWVS
ncbi:hypothetical protein Tco_1079820 [Tanacetum coccineum]|uniref:Reverse transcriptase domain-containing protein n=1 Tax=Tanacetum coccineum TaxID=301880 RepID=A0ABQ5HUD7_9ASTR